MKKKLNTIIHKYSFETQTRRKRGEENRDSFLRKGISGDWKNYFSEEDNKKFLEYTKEIILRLGYEEQLT